jgi:glycosyltransferase involved in cell wall biosynthesis
MNEPLRIAFVCDGIAEFTAGSVVSTRRFALLLKARGHEIVFIAGKAPEHEHDDTWEGMKVYRFRSMLLPKTDERFYMGFPTTREATEVLTKEKTDILHVVVPTPAAISLVRAAKKLGIPVVVHSHTQPENLFLNATHNKADFIANVLSEIMYVYLRWLYKKVDLLIFPTEFSRNYFKGMPAHMRTEVVTNGVDINKFKPHDRGEVCKKLGLPEERQYLLYVGRLHPEKRVDTLIRAMPAIAKAHPQAHALIVGGGHREASLKALTKQVGAESCVTFLGFLPEEDVQAVYSVSDIFVLPSLVELEGMVVLQAIATGNALLISDSTKSASRYLVDADGLLFKAGNPDDLAKQALTILNDPDMLAQFKAKSLSRRADFDINHSAERIEQIYYSLLH